MVRISKRGSELKGTFCVYSLMSFLNMNVVSFVGEKEWKKESLRPTYLRTFFLLGNHLPCLVFGHVVYYFLIHKDLSSLDWKSQSIVLFISSYLTLLVLTENGFIIISRIHFVIWVEWINPTRHCLQCSLIWNSWHSIVQVLYNHKGCVQSKMWYTQNLHILGRQCTKK